MIFKLVLALIFVLLLSIGRKVYGLLNKAWAIGVPFVFPLAIFLDRLNLVERCHEFTRKRSNELSHGLHGVWLGGAYTIFAHDSDSAQFMLRHPTIEKAPGFFSNRGPMSYFQTNNLANTEGEIWKRHARVIKPAFVKEAYVEYFPIFFQTNQKIINILTSKYEVQNGCDVDVRPWLSKFAIDLLGLSIFHYNFKTLETENDEYYAAYSNILENMASGIGMMFPWIYTLPFERTKKVTHSVNKLKELFSNMIKERRENGKHEKDILDAMIRASEEDEETPSVPLTDQELHSNMWLMFLAGHETTASALSYMIMELAIHQDVQATLREKITAEITIEDLKEGNHQKLFDKIHKIPYLDYVINESMRLHPPVSMLSSRVAVEDTEFKGVKIPKGTPVGVNFYAIHRNPLYWNNPDEFLPERWTPQNVKGRAKFSYLPFTLGPRQCVGNNFSLIEQRLFMCSLITLFDIQMPSNKKLSFRRSDGLPYDLNQPESAWVNLKLRDSNFKFW